MRSFPFSWSTIVQGTVSKIVLALAFLFILPSVAWGATLSFSPSAGAYEAGAVFNISVNVNSGGEAINAISGVVSFPQDQLEVVSLSKNQSIMSLWVQEPYFSNAEGTINFEGIVLNPGFTGADGKVLNIAFRAKSEGKPAITFASASVLANDGEGSEILATKKSTHFSVTPPAIVKPASVPAEIVPTTEEDEAAKIIPEVMSETNPQDGWSKETTGVFNFSLPDDVTSMRLLVDEKPDSIPTVVYTPPIAKREIEDLSEGISYLHVQYKNGEGWGEILHYKIQIDTKAPDSFKIIEIAPGAFLFEATDSLSGIARYEVQIDGGEIVEFIDDGSDVYKVSAELAGSHTLFVKAFDAAGNFITATTSFAIPAKIEEAPAPAVPSEVMPDNGFLVPNGAILITVLSIVIPSLALILLLCSLLYLAWRAMGGLRRRIDKEVREANMIVHKAFFLLKTDLEVDIETLKKANTKRKLTREEAKILKRLQKNLDEAEKAISKEVTDIEKELTS